MLTDRKEKNICARMTETHVRIQSSHPVFEWHSERHNSGLCSPISRLLLGSCSFPGPADEADSPVFSKDHSLSGARILNQGRLTPPGVSGQCVEGCGLSQLGGTGVWWVRPGPPLGSLWCAAAAPLPATQTWTRPALRDYLEVRSGS